MVGSGGTQNSNGGLLYAAPRVPEQTQRGHQMLHATGNGQIIDRRTRPRRGGNIDVLFWPCQITRAEMVQCSLCPRQSLDGGRLEFPFAGGVQRAPSGRLGGLRPTLVAFYRGVAVVEACISVWTRAMLSRNVALGFKFAKGQDHTARALHPMVPRLDIHGSHGHIHGPSHARSRGV